MSEPTMELELDRLKIDEEPIKIRFESDLYVTATTFGYTAAAQVVAVRTRRRYELLLGARSIYRALEPLREEHDGLDGLEVWISKSGPERSAPYRIEE